MNSPRGFLIVDFGSQFTQLIARRLREMNFFSEVIPFHKAEQKISSFETEGAVKPFGIILSGGPSSVTDVGAPSIELKQVLEKYPVLGICYGMQLLAYQFGGKIESSLHREYGSQDLTWQGSFPAKELIGGQNQTVWMSHGDVVKEVPAGFEVVAKSESGAIAAMKSSTVLALQFHPEVVHSIKGQEILKYFASHMCGAQMNWQAPQKLQSLEMSLKQQVPTTDHILVGLSGGVDSTVVATLLTRVFGRDRVHCVFVNNGLLRKNEFEKVKTQYQNLGLNLTAVDATEKFLFALKGQIDPEAKRKTIGRVFIEVFDEAVQQISSQTKNAIQWLAQGTLYPDVIESVSYSGGPSVTIKSHHNVGGLPEKMKLKLLEPVRDLFKDEVRELGLQMGLSEELVWRHPFPGPGLSIRILGEVNHESLSILREADDVFIEALRKNGLYRKIWQAFCVLLPVQTVGVQGDGRSYEKVLALRAVESVDGMTADWYPFEAKFLKEISNEITNRVKGINRVVYDVTSKPPATIEWE